MTLMFALSSILLAISTFVVSATTSTNCSSFANSIQLADYNATLLNATNYPINTLNVTNIYNNVSFCEIYASISYGTGNDSLIFALWLPELSEYESRFMAVGNGGFAGTIDYVNMLTQLNAGLGFAVAGGDAGHLASQNNDGIGEPGVYLPFLQDEAQVMAWIHDAISLFTPAARAIMAAYYGRSAKFSYYDGCSTGGAQGFALAQYHPDLFDGIVAGSPGNFYSHLALSFLWNAQHTNTSATNLTQAILNFTTNAVLNACDTLDGVADRLIENPLACNFNIDSLACNGSTSSVGKEITCLTPAQLTAAKAIYDGPVRSDNDAQIYPGFSLGSEIEWLGQEGLLADAFSIPILQNLVYDNLTYNSNTFNWASDVTDVDAQAGTLIDEMSPDLSAFRDCGGKMLVTQGWTDPLNAALYPIQHLEQIQKYFGGNVSGFFNLFMVPGGGHCGAATYYPHVPATYVTVPKLVDWVEKRETPKQILSSDPPDGSDTTRKLCAWPAVAKYVGGDINDWNSYVCG